MARVLGLGGFFFKSADSKATLAWYARVLGIEPTEWGGVWFPAGPFAAKAGAGTAFSVMSAETDYFEPSTSDFMFNFVVDDLDALLARCRDNGVEPVKTFPDEGHGRFAHIIDLDGRKIELWEPAAPDGP